MNTHNNNLQLPKIQPTSQEIKNLLNNIEFINNIPLLLNTHKQNLIMNINNIQEKIINIYFKLIRTNEITNNKNYFGINLNNKIYFTYYPTPRTTWKGNSIPLTNENLLKSIIYLISYKDRRRQINFNNNLINFNYIEYKFKNYIELK